MSAKFGSDLEMPPELRAIAEKNVAQARQAFDTLFDTARTAVGESEGCIEEVRSGMKDLRQKTDARNLGESTVRTLDEHARALAERVQALGAAATQHAQSAAEDFKTAGNAMAQNVQKATEQATDPNKTY
ncbi:MAG: hypothetical protein B7Z15_08690 [Rhizobiales bacterium 32-66-8]|nr:MAG: hypothetical protein B7Z15_08690 [Rhizobiales bacterium 32-66-8]